MVTGEDPTSMVLNTINEEIREGEKIFVEAT